ncbi:hypothetical protein [Peptoniphilus rhinitidis]|uniref:hypothetical protein n=1 Tax=Peptoniphilus rhinitidis TaxID=1175452 RepID=UPI0002886144|nr:hypothetical protein [Peptoniphilus rhinitidis]
MKKIKKVTLFLLILSLFSPLNIFAAKKNFNNSSGKEYKDEINKWKIERFGYKITREPSEEKNGLVNTYIDANYYVNSNSTVTGIKFDGEYKNGSSATFKDVPLRENTYRSALGTIYYKERVERVRFSPWGGYYTYTTWQNKSTSFNVLLPKSFSKSKMFWDKERYNEDKRADILAELQNFTGQLSSVKAYTENLFGVFKGNKDEDLSSKGDYVRFKEVEIEYDKKIDGKATFVASGYAPYIVKHENPKAIKVLAG